MSTDALEQSLPARGIGGILNETFVIYGRHFRQFAGLAAVVQVPVTILSLIPGQGLIAFVAFNVINLFALLTVFSATISGVGQHYVTGDVVVSRCYARVVWRIVSMLVLGTVLVAVTVAGIVAIDVGMPPILPLAIFAAVAAYMVYLAVAVPVVIVEGYKSMGALRRSFGLVRHSEWRIIGNLAVYLLVAFGLSVVLLLPFLLVSFGAAPDATTIVSQAVLVIGSVIVGVVAPPVIFIAVTLLYYDLRVRNEDYNVVRLTQEMGAMPA
jgi:hypothetical protein